MTGTTWWRQRIREQRSRRWGSSHSRPRRSLRHRKASPTKHQSITFSRRSACGDQWDADQCLNALSVASACSAVQRHEAVLVRWTRVGSCLSRNILGFGGFYLPHPSFAFSSFEEENGRNEKFEPVPGRGEHRWSPHWPSTTTVADRPFNWGRNSYLCGHCPWKMFYVTWEIEHFSRKH